MLATLLLLLTTAGVGASPSPSPTPTPDLAALEKAVEDAPGTIGCYVNPSGERLEKCEKREAGIDAFKKLYEIDHDRAVAALSRRFDEIPSPKGGYFPILAAAQVKDKAFLPMLSKVAESQKDNDLGLYATEAAKLIETGKCSQVPPPPKLKELCM